MVRRKAAAPDDAVTNGFTVDPPPEPRTRKPREKKVVIIQSETAHGTDGGPVAVWEPDGEDTFANVGAAVNFLRDRGSAGRYRILTVERGVTVAVEQVSKVTVK